MDCLTAQSNWRRFEENRRIAEENARLLEVEQRKRTAFRVWKQQTLKPLLVQQFADVDADLIDRCIEDGPMDSPDFDACVERDIRVRHGEKSFVCCAYSQGQQRLHSSWYGVCVVATLCSSCTCPGSARPSNN